MTRIVLIALIIAIVAAGTDRPAGGYKRSVGTSKCWLVVSMYYRNESIGKEFIR